MKRDTTAYAASGSFKDKADCSIRALAVATGVSYTVASMTFSARGRRLGKGTDVALSTQLHEEVLGMRRVTLAEGLRLEAFLEVARTGCYIIHKKGHAFAVIDGVVHDWSNTSKESTCIRRCWKVTEAATAKMRAMEALVKELS